MKHLNGVPQRRSKALIALSFPFSKGDPYAESVIKVFEKEYDNLCAIAFNYLNDSWVFAEDIVTEVLFKALTWKDERFKGIKNLEAYITTSVKYESINFAKKHKDMRYIQDFPVDTLSNSNPMINPDFEKDGMLDQLPHKQRQAFSLFLEDYSHQEIAQILGLATEGASKTLIYNAKKKLKQLWNEIPDDDPDEPGSSASRSKTTQTKKAIKRSFSNGPGQQPKIKDLLNYLSGKNRGIQMKQAIWLWLLEDENALDIISGLANVLRNKPEINIEARLRKGKERLRARLMQAMKDRNLARQVNSWSFINGRPINHFIPGESKNTGYLLKGYLQEQETAWIQVPGNLLSNDCFSNPQFINHANKFVKSNKGIFNPIEDKRSIDQNNRNEYLNHIITPVVDQDLLSDTLQPFELFQTFKSIVNNSDNPEFQDIH